MSKGTKHFALPAMVWALVASISVSAAAVAIPTTPTARAAASFTCTEVLGFSQTNNWYSEGGTFEPIAGDANWQERWYSGGSIDLWAYYDGAPWYASVTSACAAGSGAPDRVLINISGAYNSDPTWWQAETESVINAIANNTAHGYNNNWSAVREIILQSVVGGPNGSQCATSDTQPAVQFGINRASYNWPYINQGIDLAVAANVNLVSSSGQSIRVWHGASPTVDSCADFADGVGHLQPNAKAYIGTRLGQYYASGTAPTPTSTPVATSTPVPGSTVVPPTATPTPAVSAGAGCPCGVFSYSGFPDTADVNDPNAVELGFKFQSDIAGQLTGVRFYKGATNTGTHVGNLWSSSGQLLASGTFTNESGSGWQVVTFATPAQIQANTVYLASYHTNVGQYAATRNGLASQVDYSSLHALGNNTSGGNGVYRYGASSGFPTQSYSATNYWVDVVFVPSSGATTPPPTVTATPAPPTATPTAMATGVPPTSTATPTRTPTSVPPNTPVPVATMQSVAQTLTFNGLTNPNRTLVGQEAGAGVDFGNGPWWLSGPWGKFTSNSISFNGSGPTSAVVQFTTPKTLLQLDAFNGGTVASTLSISSPGQTPRTVTLAPNQLLTITTGFTGSGSSVTIGSTNGWDTNFDNLVVQ